MIKDIVADYLHESANKIKNNECGLSESEIIEIAQCIMHVKINKMEASDFLHMSTRNFDRKIEYGELPEGRKDIGSNQLYWYKDELLVK